MKSHDAVMPIVQALQAHIRKRPISLHVPGHKSGQGLHPSLAAWLGPAARMDVTELPGLDDLHHPDGPISDAEELAAQAFGAEKTYFLVGGSTCGNYAMLLTACKPGDTILVARDCHISVIRGLQLSGACPIYLPPDLDSHGRSKGISPETLENAIRTHPQAVGVILTYPSYLGVCCELEEIVRIAHAGGLLVLVDEAHGGHFSFHANLPKSAMACGADMAVQSTHKTLGSLTQSAMLHVQGRRFSISRLESKLRLVQSTSPSYLLLASLDAARAYWQTMGEAAVSRVLQDLEQACKRLEPCEDLQVLTGRPWLFNKQGQQEPTVVCDPFRWWIDCSKFASGFEASAWLSEQYSIFTEFADEFGFLIIWSYADSARTIEKVTNALVQLAVQSQSLFQKPQADFHRNASAGWRNLKGFIPELGVTPAEAEELPTRSVPVDQLDGKLAAEAIIPYPPGIPVILPGERWTAELRDKVKEYTEAGGKLQGAISSRFTHSLVLDV